MSTELSTTLIQEINTKHAGARLSAELAGNAMLEALNAVREVGILLEDAKNTLGHSAWKAAQAEFAFGDKQAQLYLAFARKNPEPITDINHGVRSYEDARMVTGLLPFPEGHGPQNAHEPNFFSTMNKDLTRFESEWKKQLSRSPIEQWPVHVVEQFVDRIEPLVERTNTILATAKARLMQA